MQLDCASSVLADPSALPRLLELCCSSCPEAVLQQLGFQLLHNLVAAWKLVQLPKGLCLLPGSIVSLLTPQTRDPRCLPCFAERPRLLGLPCNIPSPFTASSLHTRSRTQRSASGVVMSNLRGPRKGAELVQVRQGVSGSRTMRPRFVPRTSLKIM